MKYVYVNVEVRVCVFAPYDNPFHKNPFHSAQRNRVERKGT